MEKIRAPSEQYELIGDVFYLHAPEGMGRSKLALNMECLLEHLPDGDQPLS